MLKPGSQRNPFFWSALLIILTLYIGACSNSKVNNIERGAGYEYIPGFPELRMVPTGFIDEDENTKLNLAAEIVYGSLIYKRSETENLFQTNAMMDIQIINLDNPRRIQDSYQYPLIIKDTDPGISLSENTYLFEEEIDLEPGNYKVNVVLTDLNSNKETSRTEEFYIPDPTGRVSNITNIKILSKEPEQVGTFNPVTTYDIRDNADSIKFVFQVTNNNPDKPITLDTRLLKFRSDTTPARPMTFNDYSQSSLPYKGVDYDFPEVVSSVRRVLTQPGSVLIELGFPGLERGNYRLEVTSNEKNSGGKDLFRARDFSVKSENYPSLKTPREFAAPLVYLMDKDEYEAMMSLTDDDDLKEAVDRFWLNNVKNAILARQVIELYYERVEQANKQYSNFKEGWKTDMGMVYILFGDPFFEDKRLRFTHWSYSYDQSDPEFNYYFVRSKVNSKYYPFDNMILDRDNSYFNIEYRQKEYWRTGTILRVNL